MLRRTFVGLGGLLMFPFKWKVKRESPMSVEGQLPVPEECIPCRFCGNKHSMYCEYQAIGLVVENGYEYRIGCTCDCCMMPWEKDDSRTQWYPMEQAIGQWNEMHKKVLSREELPDEYLKQKVAWIERISIDDPDDDRTLLGLRIDVDRMRELLTEHAHLVPGAKENPVGLLISTVKIDASCDDQFKKDYGTSIDDMMHGVVYTMYARVKPAVKYQAAMEGKCPTSNS